MFQGAHGTSLPCRVPSSHKPFPNVPLYPREHSIDEQFTIHPQWRSRSRPRIPGIPANWRLHRCETTVSISSRVVVRPRLKRIAPIPTSGGTFIAFKTGDSSTDPEWQAEPVEAATPCNPPRIVEPIFPTKLTFNVLGNLSVGWP